MSALTPNRKQLLLILSLTIVTVLFVNQTYNLAVTGQAKTAGSVGTAPASGGSQKTVSVSGTGQAQIPPDKALLTTGVVTSAKTADLAVQENANNVTAIISALNQMGIDNTNIQTTQYYIDTQYYYQPYNYTAPRTIVGYLVTNLIQVTITGSGQTVAQLGIRVGQVIDAAASNGANQAYGVQFTASTEAYQKAQQTALAQAAKNAADQAHTIASALNLTITGVISVSNGPSYSPPMYGPYYLATKLTPDVKTRISPPQSLTVAATVQAVFSIA